MKKRALVRCLRLAITFALFARVIPLAPRAAIAPDFPKALFPGIEPVCSCESLTNFTLANTKIESAVVDATNNACRVTALVSHPSAEGDQVKVWIALPLTHWNGRFRGNGGGGYVGGSPASLPGSVRQGYASGATDTGHDGGSGKFALDEKGRLNWHTIQDNAYLGIHEMTVVGKALTKAFYGKAPRYSYFNGSSTGGRQGLMEAQRFPEDYDGIISGCPAINWQRFIPAILWPQVVMANATNYLPKTKLDAATAATVAVCDEMDGVKDGVIDDPLTCGFDPKTLVGTKVGDEPFTESDAEVVRKIWDGPRAPDGRFLWYGLERGADLSALAGTSSSNGSALKGKPFSIPLEWFQIFLLQDPHWDWTSLTAAGFERLFNQSVEQYGMIIGTDDPDLRRFRDHGGKIIIYHGMADQLIPAAGTINYFKRLEERMAGREETAKFARLFLAPGVDHGFRGAGATPVGLHESIVQWVEEGKAPERLMAEKRNQEGKVIRKRPLFPFPRIAKYKGNGSTDDPENFTSALP